MPELPEVETLRRGLTRLKNRHIIHVAVANAKVLKNQPEATFVQRTEGCRIADVRRRGKYLLLNLINPQNPDFPDAPPASPFIMCVHLKMRGQLRVDTMASVQNETLPQKYLCVTLFLDKGLYVGDAAGDKEAGELVLRFFDAWTWGEMRTLTPGELETVVPALGTMGMEPLAGGPWTADDLQKKLQKRSGAIKSLLLDQNIVAGVGNIYADESLFRAGIHPERAGNSLTQSEAERLVGVVQAVLGEAVEAGGTTSEEFGDVSGQAGRFVPRVYDRGGKPCVTCGQELVKIRLGGRGTVFCKMCQE